MSRIYRRHANGNYYGDWTDQAGQRQQQSLHTRDKSVAKARLKQAELGEAAPKRRKSQALSDAIDFMIRTTCHDKAEGTREMYREKGRRILSVLGDVDINDISYEMLSEYIALRLVGNDEIPKGAPGTVKKELITIRRALKAARGLLLTPVAMLIPPFSPKYIPKKRKLSIEEFDLLGAEFGPDRVLWMSLAGLTGLRDGEVHRVTWPMIDLVAGRIEVPGTKTEGSRRTLPIPPDLRDRLELVDRADRKGCVVRPWGNVRRDLHAACKRLGLEPCSPNDLRRSFASWLKNDGVDSAVVAALMGHKSTRMVDLVYGVLDPETLRSAMRSIPSKTARPVTDIVTPPRHALALPGPSRPKRGRGGRSR